MAILYRDICKIISVFLLGFAVALLVPFFVSIYYEYFVEANLHPQQHSTLAFLYTILATLSLSLIFYGIGRKATGQLFRKEALAVVAIIWLLTPMLGALPFLFSGTLNNPFQAYFELTSGFTTTGATVLTPKKYDPETDLEIPMVKSYGGLNKTVYEFYGNIEPIRDPLTGRIVLEGIEAVSKALLFWRSFTQWLGGVGIVVLFAAILPVLGVGGKMLYQAESTGPVKESLTPRLKETAISLWKIYLGLTVIQIGVLFLANESLGVLDAVTITFSTLSTGGFSIKNASLGGYNSAITEWVVIVFMILGSISFSYYYYALRGKFYRLFEPEFFLFLAIIVAASVYVSYQLIGQDKVLLAIGEDGLFSTEDAIRFGTFQVISAQTSTGFVTADYDTWPGIAQAIMLICMFFGGMAGSTAGGMKIIRVYMLFRIAQNKVESLFRPEQVRSFRVGGKEVNESSANMVLCFFLVTIAVSVLGTFLFIAGGVDVETAIGLVSCFVNNTGVAFRIAGPTGSCGFMSDFSLVNSSIQMLMGRLEFFALLAVLVPAFWRQD